MAEPSPMTEERQPVFGAAPLEEITESPPSLEERVRRLEEQVSQLHDTGVLEERVFARVSERVQPPAPHAMAHAAHLALDVGRKLLPVPAQVVSSEPGASRVHPSSSRGTSWLLWDAYTELRAIIHMYFDPRYHLSWQTRVLPLILLGLIVTSWWWVPGTSIPIFGTLLDKAVDLILGFFLYKILSREARRYRETAPDLPAFLRL